MSGTTLTASNITRLNNDIGTVDGASSGSFTTTLSGNITGSAESDAINLRSGVTLTIIGNGVASSMTAIGWNGRARDANRPIAGWRA